MSKLKSIVVTIAFSVMMAFIIYAAFRLAKPVFIALIGVFFIFGFSMAALSFYNWLKRPSESPELYVAPPELVQSEEAFNYNYSDIIEEVKKNA